MPLTHEDYTIAWICALPLETAAAKTMLDEVHDPLPQPKTDNNAYTLGNINGHNVVIVCLPLGIYGTISASTVVSHTISTFTNIRFGLLVGIGGGVPSKLADVRLGDIVVSKPTAASTGVIQYDYGKALHGGQFQRIGSLNKPPQVLLKAMAQLESDYMMGKRVISKTVADALQKDEILRQQFLRPRNDWLFTSTYVHKENAPNCLECDQTNLVNRPPRKSEEPYIHCGLIASGDQVIKDASTRDSLSQEHNIMCFEMEAAGLMDELPSLVIRGICDYCDSHKHKQWQGYAAVAAAAYAKTLLSVVPIYHQIMELRETRGQNWIVPLGRNMRFVGREREISKIKDLIRESNGSSRLAICGLGGVGKTQIALELAHHMRDGHPDYSIFWIPCTSSESVKQAYMGIAQRIGIHSPGPEEAKLRLKAYLSQEKAGKWLLIFDNVDDMDFGLQNTSEPSTLADFLPQSETGAILFTTRNRKLAMKLACSHIINIAEPDTEMAVQLLRKLLIRKELLNERAATIYLLQQLTLLPLAISQAAAYINENDIGLSEYTQLLQAQERDVIDLLSEDFGDEGRYHDIQNPVATTWLISFQQIQHLNQTAARYLSFMACINAQEVPQSLLPPAKSEKERIEAIGLLKAFSFVIEQDETHSLDLHRLVHLSTRNWLRKQRLFTKQILKAADRLSEVFPDDGHNNRKIWREYMPHALLLIGEYSFRMQEENYVTLIQKIGQCLHSDGRYNEAAVVLERALGIHRRRFGDLDPSTLTSMAWVTTSYRSQGQWKKAEEFGAQVVRLRKQVLGPEHPSTLNSMANLAATYRNQGRWQKAEDVTMRVMELRTKVLGPEHTSTLNSMANLAAIYRKQGRLRDAERLTIQVMKARTQALGQEHPSTLDSMGNLVATYRNQKRWQEAEELGLQVMQLRKRVLGAEHPSTLNSMANMAAIYRSQQRWQQAEHLNIQVMEMRERVLGSEHPDTLSSMSSLAYIWRSTGKVKDAVTLMERCTALRTKVLGSNHPDALSSSRTLDEWKEKDGRSKDMARGKRRSAKP
ncbi:hypothetical protein BDV59DRAFT_16760 [Aspergillus ambiguus]|uniref:uncharacterized protein n=1 Tax=Aspergillus ambiguus TaxID=176160 RepID=UPI003CCCB509